jgi:hypothetical protein
LSRSIGRCGVAVKGSLYESVYAYVVCWEIFELSGVCGSVQLDCLEGIAKMSCGLYLNFILFFFSNRHILIATAHGFPEHHVLSCV